MSNLVEIVSQSRLAQRVAELGAGISRDYAGRELDIVYAINGASLFSADLARCLTVPARLHPIGFSSYPEAPPTGEVRITLDVSVPLVDRHVLFVEGVVVSGRTPKYIADMLRLRRPASLVVCALGTKPRLLAVDLVVEYAAFEFDREVVVGFGVGDGAEKALPYLAARSSR